MHKAIFKKRCYHARSIRLSDQISQGQILEGTRVSDHKEKS